MTTKPDWNEIDHAEKLRVLRQSNVNQIVSDYRSGDQADSVFRERLARELSLWQPQLSEGEVKQAGKPPNKEVVLGAWRDLDRSEALLELIDNSIDAWNRRRSKYADKAAPELNVWIDIDSDTGQLTYEDNAGGVPTDKLENLVVPGYSETDALVPSIGSYKTGGKKAVFRLATAVNISTRFWNPAETGDTGVAVHLDEKWLTNVDEYRFPYFDLKNGGDLQRGQTRYLMQLRPEPVGAHWYSNPPELDRISHDIRNTYGLLIARNPNINIYFPKRGKKVVPTLDALYDFSGASDGKIDIRPQRVAFETTLDYEGQKHVVTIEIVIGCRVTTMSRENLGPGFDLYGNNRLFKPRDNRLFAEQLPKGGAAGLVRGWVCILGPNVFIPWDTHKRHLNYDREVIELIQTHPTIKELFANWSEAYGQIRQLGTGEIKKTIEPPYTLTDPKTGQLVFEHSDTVTIDPTRKRGQKLPDDIFKPSVLTSKKRKKDNGIQLNIGLTIDEARRLAAEFEIHGSLEETQTKRALSEKAKEYLMSLLQHKRPRKH